MSKTVSTSGINAGILTADNWANSSFSVDISSCAGDTNYIVTITPDGKVDPLTGMRVISGFFVPDSTGKVGIDYVPDGGSYQGELAIFNITGMDQFKNVGENWMDTK